MLERNDWLGGASARPRSPSPASTTTSSRPGIRSGSAAPRTRCSATSSRARGLEYLNTELPTGDRVPRRRGGVPAAQHRRERRRVRPARAGRRRGLARADRRLHAERRPRVRPARHRALVGERAWRSAARRSAGSAARGVAEFGGNLLVSGRDWLDDTFASERVHGLLAPWVLHTGLGPDTASSGFMAQVIAVAVQEGGMPVPRGGGARLADALVRLIEDNGGIVPDGRRGRVGRRARRRRGRRAHRRRRDRRRRRGP